MDLDFSGFIETDCGKKFKLDVFEQLAFGVIQAYNFIKDPSYVPATFSLYKAITGLYLLETTRLEAGEQKLKTTYKVLPESEAAAYLDNCALG
jgi:hypothetical protein